MRYAFYRFLCVAVVVVFLRFDFFVFCGIFLRCGRVFLFKVWRCLVNCFDRKGFFDRLYIIVILWRSSLCRYV